MMFLSKRRVDQPFVNDLSKNPSRREFLKYLGIAAAVGGIVGAIAYRDYFFARPRPSPPQEATATSTSIISYTTPIESATTAKINNPPVPSVIKVKPKYINPTTEYTVKFSHDSYDPDGDPLTTTWLIDGREVSHEPKYSTKLPEGEHLIGLRVSDGMEERGTETSVTVEPDQIYPEKPLYVKYKGINYYVTGIRGWSTFYTPSMDQMDEHLETIHEELECNAIIITGDGNEEDRLIEGCKLALKKGFERVYIHPRYLNESLDVTLEKLVKFAPKVKTLRKESPKVVYMVGREFSIEQSGIVRGSNWFTRLANISKDWNRVQNMLRPYILKVISALRDDYGYEIAYASGAWEAELIPWDNPALESVMTNAYIDQYYGHTETNVMRFLNSLKKYGKQVHSTEWGCFAFPEGEKYGGGGSLFKPWQHPEDQRVQANYIIKYLNMLNKVKIEGCYYVLYDDPYPQSMGLVNGTKRRLGFYALKSFKIAA